MANTANFTKTRVFRLGTALLLAAVLSISLSACRSSSQSQVASEVNRTRAAYGRSYLRDNWELDQKAQAWANHLANIGHLQHSNLASGITYNWRSLAENVGYGGSISQVHNAYMNSAGHRANILDRAWNYMGTGAAFRGGRVYTVQVFMQY